MPTTNAEILQRVSTFLLHDEETLRTPCRNVKIGALEYKPPPETLYKRYFTEHLLFFYRSRTFAQYARPIIPRCNPEHFKHEEMTSNDAYPIL